jgi:hypothetical protein
MTTRLVVVWLAAGAVDVLLLHPVIIRAHSNKTANGINNYFIHTP